MSESTPFNRDEDHLRLLRIFHVVCAGVAALSSCFPIFHLVFGLVVLLKPEVFGYGHNRPPAALGLLFVILAGLIMLAGWTFAALIAWAGHCLGRHKHYTFCMVVAAVACLFMPFGTVLGVFTIVVLSRPSVRALFDRPFHAAKS